MYLSVYAAIHVGMRLYTSVCGYTRRYAAVHVNRPSGISQAAAITVNCAQGVKRFLDSALLIMYM